MSAPSTPLLSDIERSIRRAGKVGRFLCTTLLILGTLFSGWLLLTIATNPGAMVKMNLNAERSAQIADFKQAPAKLFALFEAKPAEVEPEDATDQHDEANPLERPGVVRGDNLSFRERCEELANQPDEAENQDGE